MKLFYDIKQLAQIREADENIVLGTSMDELPSIYNAWMSVENGVIHDFGSMDGLDLNNHPADEKIDCTGKSILPTWVDSHTHLVFADWRAEEFEDRIKGLSYEEIAARGGGILNSALKMQAATEEELFTQAMQRLNDLISTGTGAIEIKSGYGLSLDSELKMLRVIKRIQSESPIPVKSTFLGAHAIPAEYHGNSTKYVDHVIHDMIPAVTEENLADYIDVFCESGYFNVEQTKRILEAGTSHGLVPKVHVNQFNSIGGISACVEHNALSVDHLEVMSEADYIALEGSNTIPVALPSCSFFLSIPYTPARELMNRNLPVTLATDFNPGSTPSGNMNFVISLACIKMKMTPNEAINASTLNGAAALELTNEVGSISKGKRANFIITNPISSLAVIPYHFGSPVIENVYVNGEKFQV